MKMKKTALAALAFCLCMMEAVALSPQAMAAEDQAGALIITDPAVAGTELTVEVPQADVPEGDEPTFSAVICTVPSTQVDLTGTLKPAKINGYTGRIQKDAETSASEGLVTYTATWTKTGFTVLFR